MLYVRAVVPWYRSIPVPS